MEGSGGGWGKRLERRKISKTVMGRKVSCAVGLVKRIPVQIDWRGKRVWDCTMEGKSRVLTFTRIILIFFVALHVLANVNFYFLIYRSDNTAFVWPLVARNILILWEYILSCAESELFCFYNSIS